MTMKRKKKKQQELWIAATDIAESPGHPFYEKLNELLALHGFDPYIEDLCEKFYHKNLGRPSIAPGVYFRMLLIGFFEGIDSERGVAWRCSDSKSLHAFLGLRLTEKTPDHSSLSVIRRRIDVETHKEVFTWVLALLGRHSLLKGKTIGIDATTLEANAAMRSIVRMETGESYNEYLTKLALSSGIETPTREELAKLDRKRKKKGSNDDWKSPVDPDSKITKMKDGRTHLAHKAEHAVDMDTGAIVAVMLHGADKGDTSSVYETLGEASEHLRDVKDNYNLPGDILVELVGDKGYHSNDVVRDMAEIEIRTYISEPSRGRRRWEGKAEEQAAVYGNRRRIRGKRGKALMRRRGEFVERSFAHSYETGGMRRTHLRRHENILKRLVIHIAGFNLALAMRKIHGIGKPRVMQDLAGFEFGFKTALNRAVSGMTAGLGVVKSLLKRLIEGVRISSSHEVIDGTIILRRGV